MLLSDVHQDQDLKRRSRAHSSRAGIDHPSTQMDREHEQPPNDLLCSEGQCGQAALEKGKARLELNETQQG